MTTDSEFLATLTILYVEDEPEARVQTGRFLQRRAGRVLLAQGGSQGLELFRAHRPDLVVTDIMMADMDGLQMAEEIHRISPDTPIMVITAFENTRLLLASINLGIHRYVLKPVDGDLLDRALLDCAHRVRGERELEAQSRRELELLEARRQASLGLLAAGMAHDFNNLLQAIVSAAFLAKAALQRGESPAGPFTLLDKGYDQIKELSERLTLLDPNQIADRPRGDALPLLRDCLARELEGTGCFLELDLAPDLPPIPFNSAYLGKVFANLARNAVEAMDGTGILRVTGEVRHLEADRAPRRAAGPYLHLAFADAGRGIAPERQESVFEPYASSKSMGSVKGQGLGLAVCRAVMNLHGGSITLESRPGEGSTFHLDLPLEAPLIRDA